MHSTPRTPRRQWKPWAEAVRHRSAAPQRRLLFEMCVLAVPTEGASHKRSRDEGLKNLQDLGPNNITEQEYSFTATAERETVRDVKEKLRFTHRLRLRHRAHNESYELPDGNIIIRFRCAEAWFQPVSLATRFHDTLLDQDAVVLSSGTTCASGIIVRMSVSHEPMSLNTQSDF